MKTLKTITFVSCLTLGAMTVQAQQVPMYTHYMYNTLAVNPAYAGSRDALTLTGLYRSQWVGFKGAPETQTFTMHTPLRNEHIGLGLAVVNDKIGPVNNTSVVGDFAYRIKLNEKSKLAFGISAGANLFQANLSALNLDQQTDPTFQNNVNNHVTPNVGFGAYYSRERFYAGVSSPCLLQNTYSIATKADGTTF
jgi:type IX secretion system PorP/SprF family membrane protein